MNILATTIIDELSDTITALTKRGTGLLAADESTHTIAQRFGALNIACTEETRRSYRELLFTTPGIEKYISGVILYEETILQKTQQGVPFPQLLSQLGIVPGIKVDKGLVNLAGTTAEQTTQGLDGLPERLLEYKKHGARFAKWRAVYSITEQTPSELARINNAEDLACYAAICQAAGIVPIIEPEVLLDGDHDLAACMDVSEQVLHCVVNALHTHNVLLEYVIFKPSMILPGKNCKQPATPPQIAEATVEILRRVIPAAVPSINFLSGGQTPEEATRNLNAMHQLPGTLPWNLSFSFARALQEPCMQAWLGKPENVALAQQKFLERAKCNSLAVFGKY